MNFLTDKAKAPPLSPKPPVRPAVGVFLDQDRIAVVEISPVRGSPKVSRQVVVPMRSHGEWTDQTVAETVQNLKQALSQCPGINTSVTLALPLNEVALQLLDFPNLPPNLLTEEAILLEAERTLPFPPKTLVWDYVVVRQETSTQVLFAAAKRETVEQYRQLLGQAGLSLLAIDLLPVALQRILMVSRILPRQGQSAILWVTRSTIGIWVLRDGAPLVVQTFSAPTQGSWTERVSREVHQVLEFVRKRHQLSGIAKLVVVGEPPPSLPAGWTEDMRSLLRLSVERFIPPSLFQTLATPQAWAALGLALREWVGGFVSFNLTTHEPKASIRHDPQYNFRMILLAGILALGGLAGWQQTELSRLQKELAQVKAGRAAATWVAGKTMEQLQAVHNQMSVKQTILDSIVENRIFWTQKLRDLTAAVSHPLWLTRLQAEDRLDWPRDKTRSFKIDKKQSFSIEGSIWLRNREADLKQVESFMAALRARPSFSHDFPYIALSTIRSRTQLLKEKQEVSLADFQIKCLQRRPNP